MADTDGTRTPTRDNALVLVEDQRAALAAVLILQEMGYNVDIAVQPEADLDWIRLARYQWIVCSGGGEEGRSSTFATRLRHTAPRSRILLVGADGAPLETLHELGVEVLHAPVDVNMLVDTFAEAA